jgi:hypothetical protein
MLKVGLTTKTGRIEAKNFPTREEVDTYILELDEKEGIQHFRIEENGILIETEQGKR